MTQISSSSIRISGAPANHSFGSRPVSQPLTSSVVAMSSSSAFRYQKICNPVIRESQDENQGISAHSGSVQRAYDLRGRTQVRDEELALPLACGVIGGAEDRRRVDRRHHVRREI